MSARPANRSRRPAALVALTLIGALVAVAAAVVAPRSPAPTKPVAASALPPPIPPAFTPGTPRQLGSIRHLAHWASVRRSVPARIAPGAGSVVALLSPRTPEGTRNVVAVLDHRQDRSGEAWVRVRLPVLPNGTTGWVPRKALGGYGTVVTRLEVDLRRLRATLFADGQPVLRAPVGVGTAGWPTPTGRFYIRNKLTRYRSPAYGPVAFGTSARSPRATDWPAGGFVGIHGTDRPDLIPGRVSHGCVRMRNSDVLELARRMPVGTPVTIR
jgi:lipoprotein-anchoring transpeptidase ErfK/SrfK